MMLEQMNPAQFEKTFRKADGRCRLARVANPGPTDSVNRCLLVRIINLTITIDSGETLLEISPTVELKGACPREHLRERFLFRLNYRVVSEHQAGSFEDFTTRSKLNR